jgi:hypothetical protein
MSPGAQPLTPRQTPRCAPHSPSSHLAHGFADFAFRIYPKHTNTTAPALWSPCDAVTAPAPEIDTAAPGTHGPRPLHTRADALTRQLPRAETQQLSEQSTGGWWAGHQGERQTCHCTGACERRGVVRTGILPDSSVGLPANPRSRAVILVGRGSQAGCGWAAPHRRRLLASCGAGACERRGVVRTGILPDSSATFPTNHRSHGHDSGGLR